MEIGRPQPAGWLLAMAAGSRFLLGLLGGLVLVAGLAAATVGYQQAHQHQIYPGVSVAGVALGGMTPAQARMTLRQHLSAEANAPLVLIAGSQRWPISRSDLGAHYDLNGLINTAYETGREGSVLAQLVTPMTLDLHGHNIQAPVAFDEATWNSLLAPVVQAIDRPATNATLTIGSDDHLVLTPDQSGRALDRQRTIAALSNALLTGSIQTVTLPVVSQPAAISAARLRPILAQGNALLQGPLTLRVSEVTNETRGASWTLSVHDLARMLVLPGAATPPHSQPAHLDQAQLTAFVATAAQQVDQPVRDARLRLAGTKIELKTAAPGRALSQAATLQRLEAAAPTTKRTVDAVLETTKPAITAEDLAKAQQQASAILSAPLTLRAAGQTWTLSSQTLAADLMLPATPVEQHEQGVGLNPQKLAVFLAARAKEIDQAPVNARFQWNGGTVSVMRPERDGHQLDQKAALAAILAQATTDQRIVNLPIVSAPAQVTAADVGELAGSVLIGQNSTDYSFSIPPRRHNVELAARRLNGVALAPGEIFSFNNELGPTTLASGFQVGFGIVAQGDTVKTVPSIGGGICQVATTLFQPLFWAGYEIEERYAHAYFIAHYKSRGIPGLDTTVDASSGLDFRFKNNTPDYLLIQSNADGKSLHFAIYGTPPTWKVTVDPPIIKNVVKTDRKPEIQQDPTMPKGQSIITESAEDGFDVTVRRTVTDNSGSAPRVLVLQSHYEPSHNVTLVGR